MLRNRFHDMFSHSVTILAYNGRLATTRCMLCIRIVQYKQEGEANLAKSAILHSAHYKSIRQMAAEGHISNKVLSVHAFTRGQVMPTCSLGLSDPICGALHPPIAHNVALAEANPCK